MIRKFLIGSVKKLVWGIGGSAFDFSADANDVARVALEPSHHWINVANLMRDDYRWSQVELHTLGLYTGSLDGVPGPKTKRALFEFQENNGFKPTGRLDQKTADALTDGRIGHPLQGATGSMASTSGASSSRTGQD